MIHHTAIVSPKAQIAANVSIGPFSIIHDNVTIGERTIIESHCEIGHPTVLADGIPLKIGADSLIRSHSVFYEGSTFGEGLITGHRVTVREKTNAGLCFQIGTLADIQGTCEIGDYVRFQSNVFVGQYAKIGNYVWVFPNVVLTNDPHPPSNLMVGVIIEEFAAIAAMSTILPGVTVKRGALVGAHSLVARDVSPDTVVVGVPAKHLCSTSEIHLKDGSGNAAYPWRRHFHRGYPEDSVAAWLKEFN